MYNRPYRFLPFLCMLYITIMLVVAVLSEKIIILAGHITMAGTIFIPFWFILSDVITEIYGYKISRQIIWLTFFCHLIFSVACEVALLAPHPSFWQGQESYEFVLGHLLRITFSGFIAFIISGTINIYLISRWKVLVKGKYFWLRSFGSSTIGELLYTVMAVVMIQFHILTFSQMFQIILTSYSIKVACSLVSAFPANFIVMLLKRYEIIPEHESIQTPFQLQNIFKEKISEL